MISKISRLAAVLFTIASLSGCNDNPAWTGDEATNPAGKLAQKACACVYEVIDVQTDLDVGKMLDQVTNYTSASAGETVEKSKVDEVMRALEMGEDLNLTIDNSSCMEAIEDELFNKGIGFEELMAALDKGCQLGLFYN